MRTLPPIAIRKPFVSHLRLVVTAAPTLLTLAALFLLEHTPLHRGDRRRCFVTDGADRVHGSAAYAPALASARSRSAGCGAIAARRRSIATRCAARISATAMWRQAWTAPAQATT